MDDGRAFTNYAPRCVTNFEQKPSNMTSYEYRMYLIHNAEAIMKQQADCAAKVNACEPCVKQTTMLPEQHVQECNGRTCTFTEQASNGLGVGRKY
jgi:hypothetical protein